jgi:hypothetical protein
MMLSRFPSRRKSEEGESVRVGDCFRAAALQAETCHLAPISDRPQPLHCGLGQCERKDDASELREIAGVQIAVLARLVPLPALVEVV